MFIEGRTKRLRQQQELFAWHLAPILNAWRAKGQARVTPRKLLPRIGDMSLKMGRNESAESFRERVRQARTGLDEDLDEEDLDD